MKKKSIILAGITVLLICSTISCTTSSDSDQVNLRSSTKLIILPGDNVKATTGLTELFDLDKLIETSDAIAIGTVVEIMPSAWGLDYKNINSLIHTDVIVEVEEYLYGQPRCDRIAVRIYSGRVGSDVIICPEDPVYTIGEKSILFLYRLNILNEDVPVGIDAQAVYLVIGDSQGKGEYYSNGTANVIGRNIAIPNIIERIVAIRGN